MAFLKIIEDYPNYAVNRVGQVINITTGRILQAPLVKAGYPVVNLFRKGRRGTYLVHRLVLEDFRGPAPEEHVACHNNGIRTDNRLENLRWDTQASNSADKLAHGTLLRGSKSPVAKLSERAVDEIRARLVFGETQRSIARRYGVHQSTISFINTGRCWSHYKPPIR